ncbi:cytochrome P450 [Leptodontidium sp. 2 PMI_412]|nr:cytochrome P450 [Leptodontidium sp. 2 PMI_412]
MIPSTDLTYVQSFSTFQLTAALALLALVVKLTVSKVRGRKYRLPNVVPGWPILGNSLEPVFPGGMWGKKMAEKYGEMYTCYLGGRALVFLNSNRVVYDLMEKRAAIYSSRPFRPMCQDIMSGGARMLLMEPGPRWKNQRKIMHSILNGRQVDKNFIPYQELEVKQLMHDYLTSPETFYKSNQRFSNSVITSVVFGRRAALDDPQLALILDAVKVLGEYLFNPLKNLCDAFPALSHLPKWMQWWRPAGEAYFQHARSYFDLLQQKMENGVARPCFAVDLVQGFSKKEFNLDETEKLFIFSTLLEAGSDTSRLAITQIPAAAAVYPEWAAKARAYLDEVCGHNAERLPSLADKDKLPYITAAVKECLRWRPFFQTGVPHMLTQDDEYEGYRFPKGTQFTWNAYAIALNETDYPDAMRFLPERFMDEDLNAPLKGHWTFGTGRRVCVGYTVGSNNIWIAMACLLYCFDIEQDPAHPIDTLNSNWEAITEAPFHVRIKPRSQAHTDLIRREGLVAMNADY